MGIMDGGGGGGGTAAERMEVGAAVAAAAVEEAGIVMDHCGTGVVGRAATGGTWSKGI